MKLITEMLQEESIKEFRSELESLLESYDEFLKLCGRLSGTLNENTMYIALAEGMVDAGMLTENVLDDLPMGKQGMRGWQKKSGAELGELKDLVTKHLAAIQSRVDAAKKAHAIVDKMEKGGFSQDKVDYHRERIDKNAQVLKAAVKRTKTNLKKLSDALEKAVDSVKPDADAGSDVPSSGVDFRAYGRMAAFVMRKAMNDDIASVDMDNEEYAEAFANLKDEGLIDNNGVPTKKGRDAWKAHSAKKKAPKPQGPSKDAIDDLMRHDADRDLDDLDFGT